MNGKIAISQCLTGSPVRYDGKSVCRMDDTLKSWEALGLLIPICPEILGGLPTPRDPAEICSGDGDSVLSNLSKIKTCNGCDVTGAFIRGAHLALETAITSKVVFAILKENSPSCGSTHIYDGNFSGTLKTGLGATAALFRQNNIPVFSEETMDAAVKFYKEISGCYK